MHQEKDCNKHDFSRNALTYESEIFRNKNEDQNKDQEDYKKNKEPNYN